MQSKEPLHKSSGWWQAGVGQSLIQAFVFCTGLLYFPVSWGGVAFRHSHITGKWNSEPANLDKSGAGRDSGGLPGHWTQVSLCLMSDFIFLRFFCIISNLPAGRSFASHVTEIKLALILTKLFFVWPKPVLGRIDIPTMFDVRGWERYRFMIDYEHRQVCCRRWCTDMDIDYYMTRKKCKYSWQEQARPGNM